ncbi:hypothetical protein SDC9_135278 [bioreactor metagenome]|uniref:Uncharacterized protein n=1 Tax=bioreactor metagenome TaxID=1076179 RepID=A0A645DFX8_9ZZZZ
MGLAAVERADVLRRLTKRFQKLRVYLRLGRIQFRLRHKKIVQLRTVELLFIASQRRVALRPHGGQNGVHRRVHVLLPENSPGQNFRCRNLVKLKKLYHSPSPPKAFAAAR